MKTRKARGHIFGPLDAAISGPEFGLQEKFYDYTSPRPAQGAETDGEELRKRLFKEFKGRIDTKSFYFLDGGFYLPTVAEVLKILGRSRITGMDFSSERFDCDDFAFGVRGEFSLYTYHHKKMKYGFSFGVMRGEFSWKHGTHFACYFVGSDKRVYLLEPQGKTQDPNGGTRLMSPCELIQPTSKCYSCNLMLL